MAAEHDQKIVNAANALISKNSLKKKSLVEGYFKTRVINGQSIKYATR